MSYIPPPLTTHSSGPSSTPQRKSFFSTNLGVSPASNVGSAGSWMARNTSVQVNRLNTIGEEDIVRKFIDFDDIAEDDTPIEGNPTIDQMSSMFVKFIEKYNDGMYRNELLQRFAETPDDPLFPISGQHIQEFNKTLYQCIVNEPMERIPELDKLVYRILVEIIQRKFREGYPMGSDSENFQNPIDSIIPPQIQLHNLKEEQCKILRDIDPSDVEKLVSVKGIVIRVSEVVPDMSVACFRCTTSFCGGTERVRLLAGQISEPLICAKCRQKHTFVLNHNDCEFHDKQLVKLQEFPEHIPEGETPQTCALYLHDTLFDCVKPGDRVTMTGVLRAEHQRLQTERRLVRSVCRTYMDVLHVDKTSESRMQERQEGDELCEEEVTSYKEAAMDPHIVEKLVQSLAPSIWGYEDVKKGLLCQLCGGAQKGSGKGFRSELNVLLIGDPSTAKSQLLQYVHKISPRGVFTSGKGSSAVGLTAYISKDPETREVVLESGALVLSDCGICCIDEFDKMDDKTRAILHEVMEQQTVSVAKAGIVCSLNARTAICAAANPIGSRYDMNKSVVANINLGPTLISRFDLIFLILDKNTEASDKQLADHVVRLFSTPEDESQTNSTVDGGSPFDLKFMAGYISYARTLSPILTKEVIDALTDSYLQMRHASGPSVASKTITATPRQLESVVRLSEGLCKLELGHTVEVRHVQEAVRLVKEALLSACTDPITGLIDMGILTTGVSDSMRLHRETAYKMVHSILEREDKVKYEKLKEEIYEALLDKGISMDEVGRLLDYMVTTGCLSKQGKGPTAVCRLLE